MGKTCRCRCPGCLIFLHWLCHYLIEYLQSTSTSLGIVSKSIHLKGCKTVWNWDLGTEFWFSLNYLRQASVSNTGGLSPLILANYKCAANYSKYKPYLKCFSWHNLTVFHFLKRTHFPFSRQDIYFESSEQLQHWLGEDRNGTFTLVARIFILKIENNYSVNLLQI